MPTTVATVVGTGIGCALLLVLPSQVVATVVPDLPGLVPVRWLAVLILTPTTVLGGYVGGRLARHGPTRVLRGVVVVVALGVAVAMLLH